MTWLKKELIGKIGFVFVCGGCTPEAEYVRPAKVVKWEFLFSPV